MTSLKSEYLPKRCNLVYACFVGSNCQVILSINDGKLKYLFLEFEYLSILADSILIIKYIFDDVIQGKLTLLFLSSIMQIKDTLTLIFCI